MIDHSGEVALLLATLDAAEASVRTLAATALGPGGLMRAERESTLRARARYHDLATRKTLELPTGWAEFVEIDVDVDALLQRAITRTAPLEVELREHTRLPELPERPAALGAADVAKAILGAPAEERPPAPSERAAPAAAEPTPPRRYDDLVRFEAPPQESQPIPEEPAEPAPPPAPRREATADFSYVRYVDPTPPAEEPAPEGYEQWSTEEGYDEYAQYGDEYAQYGDDYGEQPGHEPFDQEWAYGATEQGGDEGRYDPYARMSDRSERFLDIGDEPRPSAAPAFEETLHDPPSEYLEAAYEQTAGELSSIDRYLVDEDDDHSEPTQVVERAAETLLGPAAIKLGPDGGRVLGRDEVDDEEDEHSMIALGDAADYGEEHEDDPELEGVLGVGVVEYEEDEDDEDDLEEVSVEAPMPTGAPVLSEDEVAALYEQATELGKRDVAQGALLLGDVLDAEPNHLQAYLQRGRLYLDLGDFARAFSDLLRANDLDGEDPDVKVGLGDLYFARKDYSRAITYFDAALHIMPKHADALSRRGMSHYYRRNFAEAVRDLEAAKRENPNLPGVDTYLSRARKKLS